MIRTYNRRCYMLADRSLVAEERRRYRREWYAKNADRIRERHKIQQREHVARKKLNNNSGNAA
jgi:hypothetical protein